MAKSDVFTDEVEIDLDVLRALVLNWVAGHVDGVDVVTKDHCGTAEGGVKLKKELAEPVASATVLATARYSAPALERETVTCRLDNQEMRLSPRKTA
jgi:hypothetical protein